VGGAVDLLDRDGDAGDGRACAVDRNGRAAADRHEDRRSVQNRPLAPPLPEPTRSRAIERGDGIEADPVRHRRPLEEGRRDRGVHDRPRVDSAGRPARRERLHQVGDRQVPSELTGPYEVIVVDDGTDGAASAVAERTGARLLRPGGRGPNTARNAGIAAAEAELIALVDDDVEAPPGWLHAVVEGAARHPEADA